ncbi:MAG TPA: efflux RND transporter periplasmic adaptor subunit [Xanthobacteraceae bacterium]|nr:efflux RND transporter periplasmic adaptor subunit [Xanthobacteraceae bacterium]
MRARFLKSLVGFLTAVAVLSACQYHARRPPNQESTAGQNSQSGLLHLSADAIKTIGLRSELTQAGELGEELTTTAVIKPDEYRMAHVSPRIPGKAVEVFAKLGDDVNKGQALADLDSLELGQQKAAFLRAKADLQVAERNYTREKNLYAKQISSERDYLAAKGEFERSEAAYRQSREALRLLDLPDSAIARITWGGAGNRLSLFPLLSPFSGTVIGRHLTVGEQVRPDETVFTIADLGTVWIGLAIYQRDLGRVAVGDSATVTVDAYPGESFRGKIAYISSSLDPATRTADARVEIENPRHRLRLGMFATARIALRPLGNQQRAAVVPLSAVQRVGDKSMVFIERQPGTYLPREVSLGAASDNRVQVTSGLQPGDRVVTTGSFYLKSMLLGQSIQGED